MSLYDDLFSQFNQPIAQILLTKNDLADVSDHCLFLFLILPPSALSRVILTPSEDSFITDVLTLIVVLTRDK